MLVPGFQQRSAGQLHVLLLSPHFPQFVTTFDGTLLPVLEIQLNSVWRRASWWTKNTAYDSWRRRELSTSWILVGGKLLQNSWALLGIAAGIQSAGGRGYVPGTVKAMNEARTLQWHWQTCASYTQKSGKVRTELAHRCWSSTWISNPKLGLHLMATRCNKSVWDMLLFTCSCSFCPGCPK